MKEINRSNLEIKKSKFIALVYKVTNTEEVESILSDLKKEHKKARHIVYSYKIGPLEKSYADKEPSGTTRGLLDLIHFKNQDNILIVVVRYFGGILLGSGGLTRAYTKVSSMLFEENSSNN